LGNNPDLGAIALGLPDSDQKGINTLKKGYKLMY